MRCPFCNFPETKVIDSRLVGEGEQVRRRRECLKCEERYTTYETAELVMPRLIKRDGRRSEFIESKLHAGLSKALEKRPVSVERIDQAVRHISHQLRACGEREVSTEQLGKWVMEQLLDMDEVAYVRFASVYYSFENLEAFKDEIKKLVKNSKKNNSEEIHS